MRLSSWLLLDSVAVSSSETSWKAGRKVLSHGAASVSLLTGLLVPPATPEERVRFQKGGTLKLPVIIIVCVVSSFNHQDENSGLAQSHQYLRLIAHGLQTGSK